MGRKRATRSTSGAATAPEVAADVSTNRADTPSPQRSCRTRGDQIEERETEWIVPGWIPLEEVTLLGGRSGSGKSTFLAALCAQVCGGQRLETCEHPAGRTVHYYTAEESLDKVLKKRMRIANVAMGKMIFPLHNPQGYITDQLRLPNDIQRTEEWIKEDRVQLVVIDPITSFLSSELSTIDNKAIRRMIEQLIQVCLRNSVAMVMTLHDNKSTEGNTLDRFSGGAAWTQTPRNVIRLAKDAIVPGRWVMMSEKNQVGQPPKSRYYTMPSVEGMTRWVMGAENELKATDIEEEPQGLVQRSMVEEAKEWLKAIVAAKDLRSTVIQAQAKADGLSWGSVRRAQFELRVRIERKTEEDTWHSYWGVPIGGWPQ